MPTPLLYLPLKIPVRYDLVQPLANWLDDDSNQVGFGGRNSSSSSDAASWVVPKPTFSSTECRSELLRVAALRNCMSEHLQDAHRSALENEMLRDCEDYHATLLEFEKRGFPTSMTATSSQDNHNDNDTSINLTWRGAFATKQQEVHHSLVWDRACTLWNVAALQSAKASLESDPKTKEGLKVAIAYLQQAASNLALLRQIVEAQIESDEDVISTVDLSKTMLQFWETLFMAQAQMCIYKMANLGGSQVRNHTTLAYLIQGAAPLFNEALVLAQDNRLQSEVPQQCQNWAAHCKAQSLLCQARAYFHMSIELRLSKVAYGKEITRLQQTISTLEEVLKFCDSTQILKEAAKIVSKKGSEYSPMAAAAATIKPEAEGLLKLANDRLIQADKDNCNVYLEEIPKASDMPEIRAQTMVKKDLPLSEAMLTPRVSLFAWENDPSRFMPPVAPTSPPLSSSSPPPPPYEASSPPPQWDDLPPPPAYDFPPAMSPYDFPPPPPPPPGGDIARTDSDLARELQAKFDMEGA